MKRHFQLGQIILAPRVIDAFPWRNVAFILNSLDHEAFPVGIESIEDIFTDKQRRLFNVRFFPEIKSYEEHPLFPTIMRSYEASASDYGNDLTGEISPKFRDRLALSLSFDDLMLIYLSI